MSRALILAIACWLPCQAIAEATLPPGSSYIGNIRRNEQGQLVAVPEDPPAAAPTPAAPPPNPEPPLAAPRVNAPPTAQAPPPAQPAARTTDLQAALPRIIRVGATQELRSIAAAAKAARDGDTVEILTGDYYADVAVWTQDRLTIRGVGGPVRLIASGASAEGKAIWVIRGGTVTVENIAFSGTRVPDGNGAGIRFEKGKLTIRNCRFTDNETGLLTGTGEAELMVENSEFDHNGGARQGYTHALYAGALKKLTVIGSYFHHGRGGQLIKSRALESHILYNRLTDETGGNANYELEFPDGAIAYVIGNIIEQSSGTTNSNIVSFGAEGYKHERNELYLINNTIVDDRPSGGTLLVVRPGPASLKAVNNLLVGNGSFGDQPALSMESLKQVAKNLIPGHTKESGPREFANNLRVDYDAFVQATRFDYRLASPSRFLGKYVPPGTANGHNLEPRREYVHPTSTRALDSKPNLPGAKQTALPDR